MYPSGPWLCVWEQHGQREVERELSLTFEAGRVSGSGSDTHGRFNYQGTFDPSGKLHLLKQYVSGVSGSCTFIYSGQHDGEGVIAGEWHQQGSSSNRGGFELRPWDGREPAP